MTIQKGDCNNKMDEAKDLVHTALTALFAVLILTAVGALIGLGYMMWSAFSRQADANRRLQDYSFYAAFDGTEVRGQDIISLLHQTQGSPFILIYNDNNEPIGCVLTNEIASYEFSDSVDAMPDSSSWLHSILSNLSSHTTMRTLGGFAQYLKGSVPNEVTGYKHLVTTGSSSKDVKMIADFSSEQTRLTYSEIQEYFLARGNIETGISGYLSYNSYLVYEDNYTTDIVGIVLQEIVPEEEAP